MLTPYQLKVIPAGKYSLCTATSTPTHKHRDGREHTQRDTERDTKTHHITPKPQNPKTPWSIKKGTI